MRREGGGRERARTGAREERHRSEMEAGEAPLECLLSAALASSRASWLETPSAVSVTPPEVVRNGCRRPQDGQTGALTARCSLPAVRCTLTPPPGRWQRSSHARRAARRLAASRLRCRSPIRYARYVRHARHILYVRCDPLTDVTGIAGVLGATDATGAIGATGATGATGMAGRW